MENIQQQLQNLPVANNSCQQTANAYLTRAGFLQGREINLVEDFQNFNFDNQGAYKVKMGEHHTYVIVHVGDSYFKVQSWAGRQNPNVREVDGDHLVQLGNYITNENQREGLKFQLFRVRGDDNAPHFTLRDTNFTYYEPA